MILRLNSLNAFVLALLVSLLFAGGARANTDTTYTEKRVVDTVFVKPPRDTVFIYDTTDISHPKSEEATFVYDRGSISPARNVYFNALTFVTPVSVWLGTVILDMDFEFENTHDGSIILNLSTMMEFYDFEIADDQLWEGYRSVWGVGLGYRYYLGFFRTSGSNPKGRPVVHRNVSLNSVAPYLEGMLSPTVKFAFDGKYDADDKSISLDFGGKANVTMGMVWNISNLLLNVGMTVGYQYWGEDAREFLEYDRNEESGETFHILGGGAVPEGMFFALKFKIGM